MTNPKNEAPEAPRFELVHYSIIPGIALCQSKNEPHHGTNLLNNVTCQACLQDGIEFHEGHLFAAYKRLYELGGRRRP